MKHNAAESVDFLAKLHPDGPWLLTSISPDKKQVMTQVFNPNTTAAMVEWLGKVAPSHNIYFSVNKPKGGLAKKAEKTDIVELNYLHVDLDPRAGEDFDRERERMLGTLTSAEIPPTIIIDSGGGYQGFWKLEDPQPVNGDLSTAETLERYNIHLERVFGADNCHNIDRIMRLPGTINHPDLKKRKKGRKTATTHLIEFSDKSYPLSRFTPAPKVQTPDSTGFHGQVVLTSGNVERLESVDDLDSWEVADRVKVLIVQGTDPDDPGKYPSRSEALFACACALVRSGVPNEVIFSILTDDSFGIAESVLENKRPEKYALRQIERAQENAIDPMLCELNGKHAVIGDLGGKCRIISEIYDHAMRRHKISRQSFEDFRNRYRHIKVAVGVDAKGNELLKSAGTWWVDHPNRRQYETIVFAPGQEVAEAYNLWKGFAYDAMVGDRHQPLLDHLMDNICSGDKALYDYLVGWMARAVQQPDSPGEVAVILRGKMGTGKSFFVKCFGNLFGRHFMQVSDPKHLVGSFNAHLRDCVVLFGDEAFYAGDKKHESILKTLITEEVVVVEGKGVDAEAAPNYVHLVMASNSDWVVPAGPEERRYLVVDVSDNKMQDRTYFRELRDAMDNGGYENFLQFLMSYDLSEYEVRAVPKTKALQDQKLLSLSPEQQWWYEKLLYGRINIDETGWPEDVQCQALQQDYFLFMQRMGNHRKLTNVALGKFLQKVNPEGYPVTTQRQAYVTVVNAEGVPVRKKGRPYFYTLPSLDRCREVWDEDFGGPYPWKENQDQEEDTAQKDPF